MTLGAAAATLFAVRRFLLTALFLAACDGGSGPVEPPMEDRAAHCPERDPVMCAEDVGGLFLRVVVLIPLAFIFLGFAVWWNRRQ